MSYASNAIAMEKLLLQGLSDAEILGFMHVLDVMQTNLVSTGAIGNENRYSSLALHAEEIDESQCRSQPTGKISEDETGKEAAQQTCRPLQANRPKQKRHMLRTLGKSLREYKKSAFSPRYLWSSKAFWKFLSPR